MKRTKSIYLAVLAVLLSPMALADSIDYSCTDCPTNFGPDPVTFDSIITVGESGTITDLSIDISAFHTWNGDLIISLIHDAISVVLFDGSGSDDYFGGTYGPLAAFAGAELQGDWTLEVSDIFFGDAGVLSDWSMTGNYEATSVPEPGTLALLGLGLVGMAARRRKKV